MSGTSKSADIRRDTHKYDDIIDLPHHVSATHAQMPIGDRAAQFSPFAALTGYDAAVREAARLTEDRAELSEKSGLILDEKLQLLLEHIGQRPAVTITYFLPDKKKDGGAYVKAAGPVKRVVEADREIIMLDGTRIPLEEIISMDGELFRAVENAFGD